ncbi:alpha/beta hydrolase, partial [bacterium]|nr:alpha/beta hydrolase [bacterium]MBU1025417.1 alpha/beta hydrolase [bacterium]
SDGIEIAGSFRPAAVNKTDAPAMVCVPMLGRTRSDYNLFAKLLSEIGIASLAIDIRGHGDSKMDGKIRYSSFKEKQWNECVNDVNAAIGWLASHKNVDSEFIGLIGASIGANFVLKVGSRREVKLVIALSPGLDYHGVNIEKDAAKIHDKPVYVVATGGDEYSKETVSKLSQIMIKDADIEIIEDQNKHGTDMFRIPAFQEKLIRWISDNFAELKRQALTERDMAEKKKNQARPTPVTGSG